MECGLTRRRFVTTTAGLSLTAALTKVSPAQETDAADARPCFVSTWPFGVRANDRSMEVLKSGASLLTAVEEGIKVTEADRKNRSVGDGGTPNAAGVVQLDACIMNGPDHGAGSVAGIERIRHPISVARAVMEKTRHVMLVGDGAREFAVKQGFEEVDLLTPETRRAWKEWQAKQAEGAAEVLSGHDTIALVGVQANGDIAGGCSTSGMGYKLPGRVGDSPILGSGLYLDNEVGAAGATGVGENVMRYCASFMIVEAIRRGATPLDACVDTIRRIAATDPKPISELHINFVALDKAGRHGAAGTDASFKYSVTNSARSEVLEAEIVE